MADDNTGRFGKSKTRYSRSSFSDSRIMLNFLRKFILFFTPYVSLFEMKVDRFFKNIKSTDSIFTIKKRLENLMQMDLIVVNIWMEKKYKGYLYLSKGVRRKMYKNTSKIVRKFNDSIRINPIKRDQIPVEFGLIDEEKMIYLAQIMNFLMPGKYYEYIETSSFGKLLNNPDEQKLEGDCNQIVTLYIYLYSLKFPISDLLIKLLPEHVCLHFHGVDIEATNGTFAKYKVFEHILPATEIISTNLMDLSDFREDAQKIPERTMVKSAQLAFAISSLKSFVAKNLNITYRNLGVAALKTNNFETAIFYLSKTDDREALTSAYKNAAIYYMNSGNTAKAELYADKSNDLNFKNDIKKSIASKQYNELAKKVAHVKTTQDAKQYKYTFQKMLELARIIGDDALINNVRDILNKI